jgi:hypothetical protein
MTSKFFIPTKQDILDVEVGSMAPDGFGKLAKVTRIFAKQQDINDKWFVCYYVKLGEDGSAVSHDLKEDELDRTFPLAQKYTSHELDNIEAEMLKDR